MAWDFVVAKSDLRRSEFHDAEPPPLAEGQVRLAIENFALTANNITYAVFGEMMRYWDFFPGPEGFGRVPVWGFARVEASAHPEIAVGQRFYGYWPMSTHLTVQAKVGRSGFTDVAEHRRPLPPIYNQYQATVEDEGLDAHKALLQPLFITAFLIDDQFDDNGFYGARSVILSSASSKTAIGLAALLKARGGAKVVGLTSARNKAFVEGLGFYDQVVLYDDLATAPIEGPAAYVDFAGDAAVLGAVHRRFGDALKASILVGGTHWEAPREGGGGAAGANAGVLLRAGPRDQAPAGLGAGRLRPTLWRRVERVCRRCAPVAEGRALERPRGNAGGVPGAGGRRDGGGCGDHS